LLVLEQVVLALHWHPEFVEVASYAVVVVLGQIEELQVWHPVFEDLDLNRVPVFPGLFDEMKMLHPLSELASNEVMVVLVPIAATLAAPVGFEEAWIVPVLPRFLCLAFPLYPRVVFLFSLVK
jgi:hypothetical protein